MPKRSNWGKRRSAQRLLPAAQSGLLGFGAVLGASLGATATYSVVGPTPIAGAVSGCSGSISNYFDGYSSSNITGLKGISANLTTRTSHLCTPLQNNDFYSEWTMMAGGGGNPGYAQSGTDFTQGSTSYVRLFAQANTCNTCAPYSNFTNTQANAGQVIQFYTQPDSTGGIFSAYASPPYSTGYVLLDTGVNKSWSSPWDAQLYGEVGHLQSDIPGDSANQTQFKAINALENGSWTNALAGLTPYNQNGGAWGLSPIGVDSNNYKYFSNWSINP